MCGFHGKISLNLLVYQFLYLQYYHISQFRVTAILHVILPLLARYTFTTGMINTMSLLTLQCSL